jgi:hypothetical protein
LGRAPIPTTIYAAPRDPAIIERFIEAGAYRIVFNLPRTAPGVEMDGVVELTRLIRTYL